MGISMTSEKLSENPLHPKNHKIRIFGKSSALAFEINSDNSQGSIRSEYTSAYDGFYLNLEIAPAKDHGEFDWNSANSIFFKLTENEVLSLTSVFLRVKPTLEFRNRKTTHRGHPAYKNLNITPNKGEGLYFSAGVIPANESNFHKCIHHIPINQMDCLKVGMFLLGYLTLKMPWMSSDSIITALRLSESKQISV